MQKVTFKNNLNGLDVTFSSDTPGKLLAAFDGDSLGADFVRFKPVSRDGTRTLTHTLNARTVTMTVNWYSVRNGKRSRAGGLTFWERLQYTLVPGDSGTLVWTNGSDTRSINCYAAETPALHEPFSGLFSADIKLVADYPLWKGNVQKVDVFSGQFHADAVEIENTCPVPIPPLIKIEGSVASMFRTNPAGGYPYPTQSLFIDAERAGGSTNALFIDCAEQTVYRYAPDGSGKKNDRTYCLSPASEFFYLYPGKNIIVLSMNTGYENDTTVTFYRNDHYLGVSG